MQKASENFERAAEIALDFAEAFFRAGKCREQSGENDLAVELYRRAAQAKPDFAEAYLALGTVYYKEKHGMDELVNSFPIEDGFNLQDPRSFFYLGVAFFALGETDAAHEQVETLREMWSPLAGGLERFRRDYLRN